MKRLGGAEQQARDALAASGGRWKPGDRPLWENNAYWTQQILHSLARKGHVDITGDGAFVLVSTSVQVSRDFPRSR